MILKLHVFFLFCVCLSMSRKSKESRKCNRSLGVRGSWEPIEIDARIQTPILRESSHNSRLQSHLFSTLKMLNDPFYTFLKLFTEFSNNYYETLFFYVNISVSVHNMLELYQDHAIYECSIFFSKSIWKFFIPEMQDGSVAINPDELNLLHMTFMVKGKNWLSNKLSSNLWPWNVPLQWMKECNNKI